MFSFNHTTNICNYFLITKLNNKKMKKEKEITEEDIINLVNYFDNIDEDIFDDEDIIEKLPNDMKYDN